MRRTAAVLAAVLAIALAGQSRAAGPARGLQEVPLRDLQTNHGGVCRPAILVKNFGPGSNPVRYLDAARACGAKVVVYFSDPADIALVRGHPALYGYLTAKEPSLIGISNAELRRRYAATKRADPSKPVIVLLTDLPHVVLTRGMADVVMFDWYPISPRGYRAGSCATLAAAAARARAVGARVWIMVQAHRFDAGGKARPTPAQMRREISEATSCARAEAVVAHIWSHAAYQADLRRDPALYRAFLGL